MKTLVTTIQRHVILRKADDLKVFKTAKGNYQIIRDGKLLDKCSLSSYFKPCTYYSIYWYCANKNDMIQALINGQNVY